MKIGLLTLYPSSNYGGILQAVALYHYLEAQGHDVTLIRKDTKVSLFKKILIKFLEYLPFQNIRKKRDERFKREYLSPFIRQNLPKISSPIIAVSDLKKLVTAERYDALIVGSDQVWRYQYINDGHYSVFFNDIDVDFPLKKISYAASFGKDDWEAPTELAKVASLLKKFNAISVREDTAISLCKDSFGIESVKHVVDPTMLVGAAFYDKFLIHFVPTKQKTFVSYILDESEDTQKILAIVKSNLASQDLPYLQVNAAKIHNKKCLSVEAWLGYIKNADFVLTDSFHGMVFSILFNRQFLVIGNHSRGIARFISLLKLLGIENRLLTSCSDSNIRKLMQQKIPYDDVSLSLSKFVSASKRFLNDALGSK